jgi:hypothetical protein
MLISSFTKIVRLICPWSLWYLKKKPRDWNGPVVGYALRIVYLQTGPLHAGMILPPTSAEQTPNLMKLSLLFIIVDLLYLQLEKFIINLVLMSRILRGGK